MGLRILYLLCTSSVSDSYQYFAVCKYLSIEPWDKVEHLVVGVGVMQLG